MKPGYPDFTAEDKAGDHYDPKHTAKSPIWYMVDIKLDETFPRILALEELRDVAVLKDMELLKRGSRLSVQPVREAEFDAIVKLAAKPGPMADADVQAAKKSATKKPAAAKAAPIKKSAKKPAGKKA